MIDSTSKKSRRVIAMVICCLVATLFMLQGLEAANASPETRVSVRNNRLFVQVVIDGVETEALLDSGAEMTLLDHRFAARVGILPIDAGENTAKGSGGGEVPVQFARGIDLESAGIALEDMTVAILDLSDVMNRLIGHDVYVVLGRELFDSARLRLDIEAGQIQTVGRTENPDGARLELETRQGIETIPVAVEGHPPVRAEFDLGNGSDVLIGANYADRIGLSAAERVIDRKAGGGIGGAVDRDIVLLRRLEVAGVPFYDVRAAIDPTDNAADVNVGVSILRNFVITTDFAGHVAWLLPRSESDPDAMND